MYKSPNDNTLNILRNRCLWAAKPEHFNDPFDCDLEISVGITEDVMLESMRQRGDSESAIDEYKKSNLSLDGKFAPEELRRVDNLIQKLIKENKNMGVVCLSEVCDSILMPGPISRVILGIKIDDPFKSDIKDLCQERNIPCVQARKVDREFRIEVPSE